MVAPLLVPLVFGEAMASRGGPRIGLAIYAACRSLGAGANEIYKALGRPGLTMSSLLRLAVLVPVLILAARRTIVAWAQAVTSLVFVVLMREWPAGYSGLACRGWLRVDARCRRGSSC